MKENYQKIYQNIQWVIKMKKYLVIAKKDGLEIGRWEFNNEDVAKDVKREKEQEGYIAELHEIEQMPMSKMQA